MCGIGKEMAVAECETVAGPTDATITTEVPSLFRLSQDFYFRNLATTSWTTALIWLRTLATSRGSPPTAPKAADSVQVKNGSK